MKFNEQGNTEDRCLMHLLGGRGRVTGSGSIWAQGFVGAASEDLA